MLPYAGGLLERHLTGNSKWRGGLDSGLWPMTDFRAGLGFLVWAICVVRRGRRTRRSEVKWTVEVIGTREAKN